MRLRDKVAIITGGASGIGRETALLFAKEGAKVVIADLNDTAGAAVVDELKRISADSKYVRTEVSRASDVENLVRTAEESFGKLDVMMNNAGIFPDADGSVVDTPEDVWDLVQRINLKGVFLGCKYAIPALLQNKGGSIINTASFVAV